MGYDIFSVIELCGICGFTFWLIGSCVLLLAVRKARDEFRGKGYLRTPSGTHWFRFLLEKKYDAFKSSGARFYFGISHFCLVGMMIVLGAIVILLGCQLLLGGLPGGLPRGP
jgi:hypothetical protein